MEEFKREAVGLATRSGASRARVAQELGQNAAILSKWVREAVSGKSDMTPGKWLKTEQQAEVNRLRRELKRVTTERDILKCSTSDLI